MKVQLQEPKHTGHSIVSAVESGRFVVPRATHKTQEYITQVFTQKGVLKNFGLGLESIYNTTGSLISVRSRRTHRVFPNIRVNMLSYYFRR